MALTAAQLISLACQDAKGPGFTSQAGQFLNMILGDLCQQFDFEVARKTYEFTLTAGTTITLSNGVLVYGGPYPLPSDFLRVAGANALIWFNQGVPYSMIPLDMDEFDRTVQQAGMQSYPYWYAIDLSLGDETADGDSVPNLFVYPPPSGAYPAQLRYFAQMPDIATPETSSTVPWFPNQAYLRKRIAAELMGITDDERQAQWLGQADALLQGYLKLKDNQSSRAQTVSLDRRRFTRPFSALKNTKTIGW